jgi:hypothetical protein
VASLAACGGAGAPVHAGRDASAKPAKKPKPSFHLTEADLKAIAEDVSIARQLTVDHPISIEPLGKKDFIAQFRRTRGEASESNEDAQRAFLSAFNLGAPKGSVTEAHDALLESELLGFYDVKQDVVFVPDVTEPSRDKLVVDKAVVAHEVEHALQAQHFKKEMKPRSSDEALAMLSLVEGDAQVAMGAYLGRIGGAPVGRTLRRIADATKDVPVASFAHSEEAKGLARDQERLDFPYKDGMMFVADLYRAGGYDLVAKAFADPPRSSAQILHPLRYLAGDDPRPIAPLALPKGSTLIVGDALGELDTRILLERCLEKATAVAAADGWAGDRFTVFRDAGGQDALAWVSAWASEAEAKQMQDALGASDGCWGGKAGEDHTVTRKGDVVAFTRGLGAARAPEIERALFASVGQVETHDPRSTAKIPARVPLPEPEYGRLEADVYRNDWLGIVGRVPPGMAGNVGKDKIALTISRNGTPIVGGLTYSTRVVNDEQNKKTYDEMQNVIVHSLPDGTVLVAQGSVSVKTSLGAGTERRWNIFGTAGGVRMILIPICAGTGSIVVIEAFGDAYAEQVLDEWLGSFKFTHNRNLRACDYLDPK